MCVVWTSSTTFGARPRRAAASNASSATRSSGSGASERNGSSGPGGARDRTARGLQPVAHHARRVLERLALEQPREQEVALLEAHQLLVEIDVFAAGQQPARLQLDERRRDQQELGRDVEIDALHVLDLGAEHVDDARQRDLPEVDLFFQDQVQEEVERALENRCRDLVRHAAQDYPRANHRHVVQRGHQAKTSGARRRRPVTWPPMARVFSGIKPSGDMHLGNYLGAVRRWVDSQPATGYRGRPRPPRHLLRRRPARDDPALGPGRAQRQRPGSLATLLAAAGLDEDRSLLFVQSHVRAHAELTWLLNCVATFGELRRMTQFKDKSATAGRDGHGVAERRVLRLPGAHGRPTSCCTTPPRCRSATTSASTSSSPAMSRSASTAASARRSSSRRPPSPRSAPG